MQRPTGRGEERLGQYVPLTNELPGNLSLPAGSEAVQPFFLAALDGLSHAVSVMTLPATDIVQPYALDPGSGNVFVLASLGSASRPDSSTTQPGLVIAAFDPRSVPRWRRPLGPVHGNPRQPWRPLARWWFALRHARRCGASRVPCVDRRSRQRYRVPRRHGMFLRNHLLPLCPHVVQWRAAAGSTPTATRVGGARDTRGSSANNMAQRRA
jgi:hypothetical protein